MPERFEQFFPYPEFKPMQLEVMEFVFDVVSREKIGLIEAYCGFGKTIATLAPVFESGKKVLLLSPSHIARNAGVGEALKINKVNGKKIRIADLRGKQLMCSKFNSENFSHEACNNSKRFKKDCEFFNRTFAKDAKNLSSHARKTVHIIEDFESLSPTEFFEKGDIGTEPNFFQRVHELCEEKGFCSYEIMREMVRDADLVILDYFWCFTGIFHVLKQLIDPKDFVLLVDEADMLVNRLYDNFHVQIGLTGLQRLTAQANRILDEYAAMAEEGEEFEQELNETDAQFLAEFSEYTEEILRIFKTEEAISPHKIIDYYVKGFRTRSKAAGLRGTIDFNGIVENLELIVDAVESGDNAKRAGSKPHEFLKHLDAIKDLDVYLTFISAERNAIMIKPFEISNIILGNGLSPNDTLKQFHSALLFSATIGDETLFMEELGLSKADTAVFKIPCMPHQNLTVLIDTELDTTYKRRSENTPKYVKKINAMLDLEPSLLVSCCNNFEAEQMAAAIPALENAAEAENLLPSQSYVLNIRTRHARSTNKASSVKSCIVVGLPLPDYSDFYFKKRKEFLENKYGKQHAGMLLNRKAIDTAVQLTGRITRNLESQRAIVLADRRYDRDFFLGSFYRDSLPAYLKPFTKTVRNTAELKGELASFWRNHKYNK